MVSISEKYSENESKRSTNESDDFHAQERKFRLESIVEEPGHRFSEDHSNYFSNEHSSDSKDDWGHQYQRDDTSRSHVSEEIVTSIDAYDEKTQTSV